MIGYIVTAFLLLLFLICGTVTVVKHPKELPPPVLRLIAVSLFILYLYPWLEVVTNYSAGHYVYVSIMPTYNAAPFLFLTVLIGGMLDRTKFGRFCLTTASLTIVYLLYNSVQIIIYNINHAVGFSERDALYLFGQIGIVLLGFYMVRNGKLRIRLSSVCLSCLLMVGLYGAASAFNALTGQNVFGLSLTENGYFISAYSFRMPPVCTFVVNFAFWPVTMACVAAVFALVRRKRESAGAK